MCEFLVDQTRRFSDSHLSSEPVALALDCGSHAMRVLGFVEGRGEPIDLGIRDITSLFPAPGHVEVDAAQIGVMASDMLRSAVESLTQTGYTPTCLGITNMRETAVAWHRNTGQPLHNAIHWMSTQSEPQVDRWREDGTGERIGRLTGLSNESFFFGSKIRWLLDENDVASRLATSGELCVGTLDAWLLYTLTDGARYATDVSNASRYQILNLETAQWDAELAQAIGIEAAQLPEIVPTQGFLGLTNSAAVGAEIPITGLIADQQASLLGHGATEPGDTKITFGTSGVVCLNLGTSPRIEPGLATSIAWTGQSLQERVYEIEASAFHAGSTINWLSERLMGADPWNGTLTPSAAPPTRRPFVVPAFTQLGAPRWPRRTGGAIVGLQMDSSVGDIVRAGFEAMAFQAFDTLTFLGHAPDEVSVDGGGARNDYLCQFLANLLGTTVRRPKNTELTARGAAMMAVHGQGHDVGSWFPETILAGDAFEPEEDSAYARSGYAEWSNVVERLLGEDSCARGD